MVNRLADSRVIAPERHGRRGIKTPIFHMVDRLQKETKIDYVGFVFGALATTQSD